MKKSTKTAVSGVVAALGVVLMLFQGLVPAASIGIPALAGCLLIPVVAEAGVPWAFGSYGATAALSLLLAPDREAALIYTLFFGYYPALFALLGRVRQKPLRALLKLLAFNAAAVSEALLALYLLHIPLGSLTFLGIHTPLWLLLAANVVFLAYDYALAGLIATYFQRLHPRLSRTLQGK